MIFIVEGHGEGAALPVLVRRILSELLQVGYDHAVMRRLPQRGDTTGRILRVPRGKLVREADLKRYIMLAAARQESEHGILTLLDADDDLPCQLGPQLLGWAMQAAPHRPQSVVLACREYESWLLAAAPSLVGERGFELLADDVLPAAPEARPRDAKGWLNARMAAGYGEIADQGPLSACIDIEEVWRRMDSFDKLVRDVARLIGVEAPLRPAQG